MPAKRNKPGPKPKIDDKAKAQVFAILSAGASLKDAADFLEIDYSTLYRARKSDAQFAKGVDRAVKSGKIRLLQKIGKADAWQAAAWMLERKWGREFGRKDKLTQDVTSKVKSEGEVTVRLEFDHASFTRQWEDFAAGRMGGAVPPANDN